MKTGRGLLAIIATLTIFVGTNLAAPKVDPELTARLRALQPGAQLGYPMITIVRPSRTSTNDSRASS